jgi:pyruvate/2-oxoglutarate dehydrogenase complex dihydrolipoamide acyltransferase (E2) component
LVGVNEETILKSEFEKKEESQTSTQKGKGYRAVPFTLNRQMVAASLDVAHNQRNIHAVAEVDISEPRRIIQEHQRKTGEKLSLTAYVVTCVAQAIAEHPHLNAFRKGKKLINLDDVTIGVVVERELDGEVMPENMGIQAAQNKTHRQIQDEIRAAQEQGDEALGGLSGFTWVRFIPGFLLRAFVRFASRNIYMMKRYGAVGVTAVGMFAAKNEALWMIPLVGGATVAVAVGGIVERPCIMDGEFESREHLCLTVTFNHEVVDGGPAARFMKRFSELLRSGELL